MRITVFGGTGRTGQLLVQQALEAGYKVVVYARNPGRLTMQHERLSIVTGTLDDREAIAGAIRGTDAVIELVGAINIGTENVIAAMKQHGVRRLIVASALSISDPRDKFDVRRELLFLFVRLVIPHLVRQVIRSAELVRTSGLDWTLVRIPGLRDTGATGKIQSGYTGTGTFGFRIARADLAAFMLAQIKSRDYTQSAPAVSS